LQTHTPPGDTGQAMSQENVEVVQRALAALDRRDVEAYLEVASPQIELITPASPLQGPITGHDGIREFFRELWTYSEASGFEIEEVKPVGERVLAFFSLTATGRKSEVQTSVRVAGVYDLEAGKIRRAHIFADRAEALAAVGLSE
jgi:ketosteroid isomerase-like protein